MAAIASASASLASLIWTDMPRDLITSRAADPRSGCRAPSAGSGGGEDLARRGGDLDRVSSEATSLRQVGAPAAAPAEALDQAPQHGARVEAERGGAGHDDERLRAAADERHRDRIAGDERGGDGLQAVDVPAFIYVGDHPPRGR